MIQKRLKRLVIGGAIVPAIALGSSADAVTATARSGSSSAIATAKASGSGGPPASITPTHAPGAVRGGSAGAMHHVRDGWIRDLHLTATSGTPGTTTVPRRRPAVGVTQDR
jgi:hypothetical protein